VLVDRNVRLHLKIIDTCGFGDQLNTESSSDILAKYVEDQFEKYLEEELRIKRHLKDFPDPRVHLCLYFVNPTGHGLRPLDIITMKKLHDKVNLLPIIAKADTVTKSDLVIFKQKILMDMKENGIVHYQFPLDDANNEELIAENIEANEKLPFAVVGSNEKFNGRRVRVYPWGTVHIDDCEHCEFSALHESVILRNLDDVVMSTLERHYENYRKRRLPKMGYAVNTEANLSFSESLERERARVTADLHRKEEEMRATFIRRVKDKETELQTAESQLTAKYNKLKGELEIKRLEIDDERQKLEVQKMEFERAKEEKRRALEDAAVYASNSSPPQHGSSGTLRGKKK
jgi:septin family protein